MNNVVAALSAKWKIQANPFFEFVSDPQLIVSAF